MDPVDAFKLPFYDYALTDSYGIIFKAMNEKDVADDAWKFIKKHRLEIPFTDFNINPFFDDEEKEKKNPEEFVNIMELVKYSEVSGVCDSLA
jgi:hypothetical protein